VTGGEIELRLARRAANDTWLALVLGAGDWRTPTEHRPPPRALVAGERLELGVGLSARVVRAYAAGGEPPRLVELAFEQSGAPLWSALYRHGRPVQYSYVRAPLELWHVQTPFASRPWAMELPSASRPLAWQTLLGLRQRGVELAAVTHAAGLSSTGVGELDALLPLPERFEVNAAACAAIRRTRERGGRVIAAGTTVVRALESAATHAIPLTPTTGEAELRIDREHRLRVVDGVLTGMHEPTTSHFALLEAFADRTLLERAHQHAITAGYLAHEFGDSLLVAAA
jgi:S-adenosylmethionine:tRNA ribosyltransferase-isomerase